MTVSVTRATPRPLVKPAATRTAAVTQGGAAQKVLTHKTASGNSFGVSVAGTRIDSNGNFSYDVKVRYDDSKGLFKDTQEITSNATATLTRRTFGKGGKVTANGGQATASGLVRVGPNTFEGIIHVPLLGKPGEFREDVTKMGFSFGQLKNNSWEGARFDGKPYQEYSVPLKLKGP